MFNATALLATRGLLHRLRVNQFIDNKRVQTYMNKIGGEVVIVKGRNGYTLLSESMRDVFEAWVLLQERLHTDKSEVKDEV